MGSTFEYLDARISKVKKQFIIWTDGFQDFILQNESKKINWKLAQPTLPCHFLSSLVPTLFSLATLGKQETTSQNNSSTTTRYVLRKEF
jgi:hypothetical protein